MRSTTVVNDNINIIALKEVEVHRKYIINALIEVQLNKNTDDEEVNKALNAINSAYDYALSVAYKSVTCNDSGLSLFLSAFSDELNVTKDSIIFCLESSNITFDLQNEIISDIVPEEIESDIISTSLSSSSEEFPTKDCYIAGKSQHNLVVNHEASWKALVKKDNCNILQKIPTKTANDLMNNETTMTLKDYIEKSLVGYNISSTVFKHPVFNNLCISIYPSENNHKVDISERFIKNYQSPELNSKYARPMLDIEIIPQVGPCVRCYLTLAGRPRLNSKDKDIIQDAETGEVLLVNVNLMNFGDPLRALSWVEDYVKNRKEHHGIPEESPIIRTFLISLEEYNRTLGDTEVLIVDADRAPGQVRVQGNSYALKAIPNSLVSFMNQPANEMDGNVKPIEVLSEFVVGEAIHPVNFTQNDSDIAHQHGRPIETTTIIYSAFRNDSKISQLFDARDQERKLAGFTSKVGISKECNFVKSSLPNKRFANKPSKASTPINSLKGSTQSLKGSNESLNGSSDSLKGSSSDSLNVSSQILNKTPSNGSKVIKPIGLVSKQSLLASTGPVVKPVVKQPAQKAKNSKPLTTNTTKSTPLLGGKNKK